MNKFKFVGIPFLLLLSQVFLNQKQVLTYVSNSSGYSSLCIQLTIGILTLVLFGFNYWFLISDDFKRFENFENFKYAILYQDSNKIIEEYRDDDVELRFNVMLVQHKIFHNLVAKENVQNEQDKRTLGFFCTILVPHWRSENMNHDSDADLEFAKGQGACGVAYETKSPTLANLVEEKNIDYGLNKTQRNKTDNLKFVFSFPIRKKDPNTNCLTNEIIGVVNIDSSSDRALDMLNDEDQMDALRKKGNGFSELCSNLF